MHLYLLESVAVNAPRSLELVDIWREAGEHVTDVSLQTQRLTLDVVGLVAFSHDFQETQQIQWWVLHPLQQSLLLADCAVMHS